MPTDTLGARDCALSGTGNHELFAEVFKKHYSWIYLVALRYCRNSTEADDIAQESLSKAFASFAGFRGESKIKTWLHRITANTALNRMSRHKRYTRVKAELIVLKSQSDEAQKTHNLVRRAIACLPELERRLILYSYFYGFSHKEIAEQMQCPESTISWKIARAREKLGELIVTNKNKWF